MTLPNQYLHTYNLYVRTYIHTYIQFILYTTYIKHGKQLLQRKVRSIPREDVAEVCVQALLEPAAQNKAFDLIVDPDQPAPQSNDWNAFFSQPGTCRY